MFDSQQKNTWYEHVRHVDNGRMVKVARVKVTLSKDWPRKWWKDKWKQSIQDRYANCLY